MCGCMSDSNAIPPARLPACPPHAGPVRHAAAPRATRQPLVPPPMPIIQVGAGHVPWQEQQLMSSSLWVLRAGPLPLRCTQHCSLLVLPTSGCCCLPACLLPAACLLACCLPADSQGHGTAVAGALGATTNNSLGVSGVIWNVSAQTVQKAFRGSPWACAAPCAAALPQWKRCCPARLPGLLPRCVHTFAWRPCPPHAAPSALPPTALAALGAGRAVELPSEQC